MRIQPGYSEDTARIQSEYSQDTVRVQPGYSKDTARIDKDTARIQSGYNEPPCGGGGVCGGVCSGVCMICLLDLCHPLITYANNVDPDQDRWKKRVNFEIKKSQQTPTIIGSTSRTRERV